MELSCDKKMSLLHNTFGHMVILTRDKIYFTFNKKIWRKFRYEIPMMLEPKHIASITKHKRIYNKSYKDENYICFEQDFKKKDGQWIKLWINLSMIEWQRFVYDLWRFDEVFGVQSTKKCYHCNNIQQEIKEIPQPETQLTANEYMNIVIANGMQVQPERCEYCGEVDGGCHCHQLTCRKCTPSSFCNGCGSVLYKIIE